MQTFFKNIVLEQTLHCNGGTFSQKCDKLDLYISPSPPQNMTDPQGSLSRI